MKSVRTLYRLLGWAAALGSAGIAMAQTATLTTPATSYSATGGSVTLTLSIQYDGKTPSTLGANIALPPGWSYTAASGTDIPNVVPVAGDTGAAEFAYTTIPANAATFTFTLAYTPGLSGSQSLAGTVLYKIAAGALQTITLPPLVLAAPPPGPTKPAITSQATATAVLGEPFRFVVETSPAASSFAASGLPAGVTIDVASGVITGTFSTAAIYPVLLGATNAAGATTQTLTITVYSRPAFTTLPHSASAPVGGSLLLTAAATGSPAPTYQWQKNGVPIAGAIGPSLTLDNLQVGDAGSYAVVLANLTGSVTSPAAVIGVSSTAKVAGLGSVVGSDIVAPNGNVYDQVLLTGRAATITADPAQITRVSFIDLNDDIVQVEFSGAGALTLSLENASGPAAPVKYNQAGVTYMKGHASLVITGADETTNLSVFSVGTLTAVNQALFKAGETYDGLADLGLISIASTNGRFGGIRTADAAYFRTAGLTGLYAPGIAVTGPTYLHEITADADATPVLVFGATTDVRVAGGNLLQLNQRPVQVDGITHLAFTAGVTSGNVPLPAQANRARFERNGVDITDQLLAPGP